MRSHRRLAAILGGVTAAALLEAVPSAAAQSSPMCQFAAAAVLTAEVELEDAKRALRKCTGVAGASCSAEGARARDMRHRLKLARDYLERYCLR